MAITFDNFDEAKGICAYIAKTEHTIMEAQDYPECEWGSIVFMTDHFGGSYLLLHYDHKTGILTKDYGHDDAEQIASGYQLLEMVRKGKRHMESVRDLDAISEMVNAEHD